MKHLKRIIIVFLIIIVTVFIASVWRISPFLGSDGIFIPGVGKMDKILTNDYDQLSYISKYMLNINYDNVTWDSTDNMF